MGTGSKVWVIGLDGATWELMSRYMGEGKLPCFGRLREEGGWGVLRSTEPPLSPAAWTTFATGKKPGKHGVLDHVYRKQGTYDASFVNATLRGATPLWLGASRADKKVGLINIPLTYPPEPVNGFMITGMYTPSDQHPFTYPPELADELRREIGGYSVLGPRSKEDLNAAIEGIMAGMEMRIKASMYLLERYDPDLFIVVLSATDTVQHKFWRFMDPQHPDYTSDAPSRFATAIEEVYGQVDGGLRRILERAPEGTAIVVMSDHGACALHKYLYLNNWLIREGFLRIKTGPLSRMRYGFYRLGITPFELLRMAAKIHPTLTDKVVGRVRQDMSDGKSRYQGFFLSWKDIDWARTRAYALVGNLGGFYVNLKGREPQGIVNEGEEYERVREELLAALERWVDPDDGRGVVESAYRREAFYEGPYLDRIPDVVFTTSGCRYMAFGVHEFASNAVMAKSPWFSGAHSPEGILVLNGEMFKRGAVLPESRLEDITPTILHVMGLPVPEDFDGKVLEEAFEPEYLTTNPIRYGEAWDPVPKDAAPFTREEESAVRARLEGLGYL